MAKDDYFVIVYQILSYLYKCLKTGTKVEAQFLKYDGALFDINERYWCYIMETLDSRGLVRGLEVIKTWEGVIIGDLENAEITPEGIDYLCNNPAIKRAYDLIKDILNIIPIAL